MAPNPPATDWNDDDDEPTYPMDLPTGLTGGIVKTSSGYAEKGDIVTDRKSRFTFKMSDGRADIEVSFKKIVVTSENLFYDVGESAYYYDAVLWTVENSITKGTTATTFVSGNPCTRTQSVTFLFRN